MRPARWLLLGALLLGLALAEGARAVPLSPASVAREAAWVASGAAAQARKRPKSYWEKNHLYHVLDALILSSPLTGLAAIVLLFDPEVRQRPPGVLFTRDEPEEGLKLNPRYRRRVRRKLIAVITLGALCALGLLTLLFHLLDLIPHI